MPDPSPSMRARALVQPGRATRAAVCGLALGVLALAGGCSRRHQEPPPPPPPPTTVEYGSYRSVLTVPGGELPFGLDLAIEEGNPVAYLLNGAERVRITDVDIKGTHLELAMPGYENRIVADATPQGLSGHASMLRPGGKFVQLPFKATLGKSYRFLSNATPGETPIAGRWAATFVAADGKSEPAVAEFTQNGADVIGTFLTPSGDHRFLAGQMDGRELYLSRFDGGSAYLYRARLADDGTLTGKQWSGSWSVDDWNARRDDAAVLPDPSTLTMLKKPTERFAFSFPDLDGKTVSLSDARFRGKVVVVSIGGSWCPNCHDEAAFLTPYYARLNDAGLEIVYLQFEYYGDMAQAVAANRRFVDQFNIEWPVLIAGISDKQDALTRLPQLQQLTAYPTTLFIDRKGKVRKIHTGFSGPATGARYGEWATEFDALVTGLLAEKP